MASEREKKRLAKERIRNLPRIPPKLVKINPALRIYELSKLLAEALIEVDPLNIISSDPSTVLPFNPNRSEAEYMRLRGIAIKTQNQELENQLALESGTQPTNFGNMPSGRDVIRSSGQFDLQNLLPRFEEPVKRTRRKTKTDKNMSKALRQANDKFRTSKGKLRKGATQAQIMKFAHRLLRKMK